MQNGNHVAPELFQAIKIPATLVSIKKMFLTWVPLHEKLIIGARLNDAFTKPRVNLSNVTPQFMAWIISNEIYGVAQFLRGNKKLEEITKEIVAMLDRMGKGEDISPLRMLELGEALLPYGERLTDKDHVSAGAAWQAIFNATVNEVENVLRYGISANVSGQPGNKEIALVATINVYIRKVFELLKA